MSKEIAKKESNQINTIDINNINSSELSKLDLNSLNVMPADLMADYWTPTEKNESKRLIFYHIGERDVLDQNSGEVFSLECAFFMYPDPETKTVKMLSNGSKRLVGALQSNNIQVGTPLLITYLGKKKNATNQYQSDNWSIKPLIIG